MIEPLYFSDKTNKIFHKVLEDYFIVIHVHNWETSITRTIGSHPTELRLETLNRNHLISTEEIFNDIMMSAIVRLGLDKIIKK